MNNTGLYDKSEEASNTPPAPIEAERKFLVEIVGELPECRELEITQTYLKEKDGVEPRIRKRKENGKTEQQTISFTYKYDSHGNWTSRTVVGWGKIEETTSKIEYYE